MLDSQLGIGSPSPRPSPQGEGGIDSATGGAIRSGNHHQQDDCNNSRQTLRQREGQGHDIILATLNAKYIHPSFGLRYLLANLGGLRERACLIEFDIHQSVKDVAEAILSHNPKILGLGVYIWNATATTELVATLKRIDPQLIVILGGPEVSFETEKQEIVSLADYVICGEADLEFATLCGQLLGGERPELKIITAPSPDLNQLVLPYECYTRDDVAHRIVYVEASRGCPFGCEFCLSSLDSRVRQFPLSALLSEFEKLLERGVKHFKFVDRTFNINIQTGRGVLEFFLERMRPGLFLHFEMVPDRLPNELRELIVQFPAGTLQFEVGVQTFNPEVCERIARRQDYNALQDNFHFLREKTTVHIHADLIVGLPGEDLQSFGSGFDRLYSLNPHEIQVGILKRLRGAPIARHDSEWEMIYSPEPPWEVLKTRQISFGEMQRMRRFARFWDLVANSGNFVETTRLITERGSAFQNFMQLSEWLYAQVGRQHAIALPRLAELLWEFLLSRRAIAPNDAAATLWRDWQRAGRCEKPSFLAGYISNEQVQEARKGRIGPSRQARHLNS